MTNMLKRIVSTVGFCTVTALGILIMPSAAHISAENAAPMVAASNDQTIDTSVYIDDRSDPVRVLQSLFNAINRREYVRAYAYWKFGGQQAVIPYAQFEAGYQNTQSVALTTGMVSTSAGASQLNYRVPVALVARTTAGAVQTFVGCYTLHLSQPGVQAAPPFVPMGIRDATVRLVANNTNITALLPTLCN